MIFQLFIHLYASQFIRIDDIGIYNVLYQYYPLISLIIFFGMRETVSRFLPIYKFKEGKSEVKGLIYFTIILNSFIAFIFFGLIWSFSNQVSTLVFQTTDYSSLIKLFSLNLIFVPAQIFSLFFSSLYHFKTNFFINLIGNFLNYFTTILFLNIIGTVDSFFYGLLIGESFKFIFFLFKILFLFKIKDLKMHFKEILNYGFFMFLNNITIFIRTNLYNVIFYFFFQNNAKMGIWFFVNNIISLTRFGYESIRNVLTVYYTPIINNEDLEISKKSYYGVTSQLSRLMPIIGFLILIVFNNFSPIIIKTISFIYNENFHDFIDVMVTFGLYGIFFLIYCLIYLYPTLVHLYKKGHKLLILQLKVIPIYIIAYYFFIRYFGIVGIAISNIIGLSWYFLIIILEIRKKYQIGFDFSSLKKVFFAFSPGILSIPVMYYITLKELKSIYLNLGIIGFYFPLYEILIVVGLFSIVLFSIVLLIRKLKIFSSSDSKLFEDFLGKRFGEKLSKILIKHKI